MQRREMLKAVAGTVAVAMTASVMAASEEHAHHHEHSTSANNDFAGLIDSSTDCLKTGEACLAHCITLLGQGDKEMAGCAQSVSELLATCDALMKLASQKSSFTPAMAKVTADVCASCELTHRTALPLQYRHLEAMAGVQVHMQGRAGQVMVGMQGLVEALGQLAGGMVVQVADHRHAGRIVR